MEWIGGAMVSRRAVSFLVGALLFALSPWFSPAQAAEPVAGQAQVASRSAPKPEVELPFACGSRVVVSQAHGTFSHVGTDRWAWDFRVPVGTPIHAAHAGTVRMVRSDSVRGGCDRSFGPDANYVILTSDDGLETQYLHLSRVAVRLGERVAAGQVLGKVGTTGFSCGAHLHFQVQETKEGVWAGRSKPALFREIGDPEAERLVESQNCGRLEQGALVATGRFD